MVCCASGQGCGLAGVCHRQLLMRLHGSAAGRPSQVAVAWPGRPCPSAGQAPVCGGGLVRCLLCPEAARDRDGARRGVGWVLPKSLVCLVVMRTAALPACPPWQLQPPSEPPCHQASAAHRVAPPPPCAHTPPPTTTTTPTHTSKPRHWQRCWASPSTAGTRWARCAPPSRPPPLSPCRATPAPPPRLRTTCACCGATACPQTCSRRALAGMDGAGRGQGARIPPCQGAPQCVKQPSWVACAALRLRARSSGAVAQPAELPQRCVRCRPAGAASAGGARLLVQPVRACLARHVGKGGQPSLRATPMAVRAFWLWSR